MSKQNKKVKSEPATLERMLHQSMAWKSPKCGKPGEKRRENPVDHFKKRKP